MWLACEGGTCGGLGALENFLYVRVRNTAAETRGGETQGERKRGRVMRKGVGKGDGTEREKEGGG